MHKSLKINSLWIVVALAQPSQIKTQEQYDQAKEFVQEKMRDAQRDYPLEYQAAKTGFAYGALAGATKSFIPCMPRRGKGFISCALIGAAVGSCANVALNCNASYLIDVKNKLECAFSDEGQKDRSVQAEQKKENKDLSDEERTELLKKIAYLTAFLFA